MERTQRLPKSVLLATMTSANGPGLSARKPRADDRYKSETSPRPHGPRYFSLTTAAWPGQRPTWPAPASQGLRGSKLGTPYLCAGPSVSCRHCQSRPRADWSLSPELEQPDEGKQIPKSQHRPGPSSWRGQSTSAQDKTVFESDGWSPRWPIMIWPWRQQPGRSNWNATKDQAPTSLRNHGFLALKRARSALAVP